jgi:hypothetical protein
VTGVARDEGLELPPRGPPDALAARPTTEAHRGGSDGSGGSSNVTTADGVPVRPDHVVVAHGGPTVSSPVVSADKVVVGGGGVQGDAATSSPFPAWACLRRAAW